MRILIVSQYYYPEQFQLNEIAPELVKRGFEVTVLCGLPNYPHGIYFRDYETLDKCRLKDEEYYKSKGVRVIRVKQYPRGSNPFSLVLNYMSFIRNSLDRIKKIDADFDLVLGYQLSPITSMYAAIQYKKLYNVPLLYYTLDIWPVSAESLLKSKKNPLFKLVAYLSKKIYLAADRILVTSRPFIDYLHSQNKIPLEKIGYLPQHAGKEMLEMNLTADNNGIADFMFAGNIGNGQRLDVIVEAASILGARNDYKIHFVGDGRMREKLQKMVIDKGLENNIIFYGNQKREDMPNYYKIADALLITLRGNNEVGNTMPGKLQMYMTAGKPIFGAINGAAQEVILEAKCGGCVAAGDAKGLADLMKSFIINPEIYKDAGENARRYFCDNFTFERYMDILCSEINLLRKKFK